MAFRPLPSVLKQNAFGISTILCEFLLSLGFLPPVLGVIK
jgi:hypothetical protein